MSQRLLRRFVWLLILLPGFIRGQNLVPNGSFEFYQNCPSHDNQLEEATPWYNPNKATPDFYNRCYNFSQIILPPRSGQGLAHLFFDQNWGEYLGVRLNKPLRANQCYYFEMYVATNTPGKYLTGTIGAYLSNRPTTAATTDIVSVRPQVLDNTPRNEIGNLQWMRVAGNIKAEGGEEYLTVGSFYKTPAFLGFYDLFIDDIKIVPITLDLGADTTLCSRKATRLLDATTPGGSAYRWSDGSTRSTFLVTKPGKYSVTVVTSCVTLTDSITVDYALNFDLGADTTLCASDQLTLQVPVSDASRYQWQDGSRQNTFMAKQTGSYSITVTQTNCVATDTIQVRFIQPPKLDLGPDKELCGAQMVTIKPNFAEGKFSWQDQFAQNERTVGTSGVFRASVSNDCATVTDSIQIDYGACDCILYAPNSFTPNGDGMNDVFLAYGCGDMRITSLLIFNRWGEVVFKTTTHPFQWDGQYRGESCETGEYAWRIQYELRRGRTVKFDQKQGSLNLIR